MKLITISLVAALAMASFVVLSSDDASAASSSPYEITDGTGQVFRYDRPSDHVVVAGFAAALTLVDLGLASKIVGTDTYGAYDYYKNAKLEVLKDRPSIGSIGTAGNNSNVVATLAQWVEEGRMSLDDTVIFTTYITNGKVLRGLLEERGFTHVLIWGTISEYGDIADMVDTLSMAMTGKKSTVAEDMRAVQREVASKVAGIGEKSKALFVWWTASSPSDVKVGSGGSLAVSLIMAAGGENAGYNPQASGTYGDKNTMLQILEANPGALLLLDSSYVRAHGVEQFRQDFLGGKADIRILALEQTWNNYCPESADGLWAIAQALYPDVFGGMDKPRSEAPGENPLTYAVAGAVVAIIVAGGAVWFLRRP
ncbi:MAG: hypothetical protein LBG62_01510 [Candidatus Methanoplasma sp.]|jgi:ABC-type Fe3+-hydroxamate transport system substrate-binding protein|nr:hypothetical protein [Candidatus Methanoplasma sp.]